MLRTMFAIRLKFTEVIFQKWILHEVILKKQTKLKENENRANLYRLFGRSSLLYRV